MPNTLPNEIPNEVPNEPPNEPNRPTSRAEPNRAERSRAEPSRAEPSGSEPSRAEPSRAEREPTQAGAKQLHFKFGITICPFHRWETLELGSSYTERSRAEPSRDIWKCPMKYFIWALWPQGLSPPRHTHSRISPAVMCFL